MNLQNHFVLNPSQTGVEAEVGNVVSALKRCFRSSNKDARCEVLQEIKG